MLFEEKKLGIESIDELLQCEISTVEPYALMLAPVYVFMKLNQKLVSVKAPLDFFTPAELAQLSRYEIFYIPKSVQSGSRFQTAAKVIRNLLSAREGFTGLSPAHFEISNEVILTTFSLWGKELCIDPFFSAVFADELCGALNPEKMLEARERAVVRHDRGILVSGLLSFVLIHLGWFDLELIKRTRFSAYEAIVDRDETWSEPSCEWELIARDLVNIVSNYKILSVESLQSVSSEWNQKILGRLGRIKKNPKLKFYPSIYYSEEVGEIA